MVFIWQELLFRPLLNLLIGLYNTVGLQNLGIAIIWLTIITRIVLLPASLKDKKKLSKESDLRAKLAQLQKSYGNNPSVLRLEQRKLLKERKFRKWPKVILLGVQGLVLVILYRVFLGGINVEKIVDQIYSFVSIPPQINTIFLGIDIAQRSFILSFLCALLLFGNIWAGHRKSGKKWQRSDLLYAFGFPLLTFLVLWYLAAVKALFIITSMIFSNVLRAWSSFRESVKEQNVMMKDRTVKEAKAKKDALPQVKDRF